MYPIIITYISQKLEFGKEMFIAHLLNFVPDRSVCLLSKLIKNELEIEFVQVFFQQFTFIRVMLRYQFKEILR